VQFGHDSKIREEPMITVTKAELPSMCAYIEYLSKIWENRWLTNDGELVQALGKRLEEYLGVKDIVLLSNGTLALQIALRALSVKGEVITTPFTFAASTNVIVWEGLTPVFADIDRATFNLDPVDVKKKITEKTSAILAVHVYGNPCYVKELQEIAFEHNLKIIYDAAHAFGVQYDGHSVLDFGNVSTLSFHATKIFNTIEGGAVLSKDSSLVNVMKQMRNHGIVSEEEVVIPGINAKMNEFQAAMGLCNLDQIEKIIYLRKSLYDHYVKRLGVIEGVNFQKLTSSKYNYSYMPVLFNNIDTRDRVYNALLEKGIKARKYFFPLTVNFDYFKDKNLVEKYSLNNSFEISNGVLCLPLYHDLGLDNVDSIADIVEKTI
jgi:dTDP-4-amino-4,6-dideoxygalactose transaminase